MILVLVLKKFPLFLEQQEGGWKGREKAKREREKRKKNSFMEYAVGRMYYARSRRYRVQLKFVLFEKGREGMHGGDGRS